MLPRTNHAGNDFTRPWEIKSRVANSWKIADRVSSAENGYGAGSGEMFLCRRGCARMTDGAESTNSLRGVPDTKNIKANCRQDNVMQQIGLRSLG